MNHSPEKHAGGDYNSSPLRAIAAVVDPVHQPYHVPNGSLEKAPSTSSSDSDDDDFFHLEATELRILPPANPPVALVSVESNVAAGVSGGGGRENRKPPPPPPARYDVPDPSRIPPSIFARNAATSPMDWSVASNESLFSIQMGNSSFSREQGMFLIGRSGDLGNFMSGPLEYPPPRPPTERGTAGKGRLVDVNEMEEEEEEEGVKVLVVKEKEREKKKEAEEAIGHSISRHSDGSSTTSIRSFAFPLLSDPLRNLLMFFGWLSALVLKIQKQRNCTALWNCQQPAGRLLESLSPFSWHLGDLQHFQAAVYNGGRLSKEGGSKSPLAAVCKACHNSNLHLGETKIDR